MTKDNKDTQIFGSLFINKTKEGKSYIKGKLSVDVKAGTPIIGFLVETVAKEGTKNAGQPVKYWLLREADEPKPQVANTKFSKGGNKSKVEEDF